MTDGVYLLERIRAKCIDDAGCWIWQGFANREMYPVISIKSIPRGVRRVAWECERGPVPRGYEITGNCEKPMCVNPEHSVKITIAARRKKMSALRDASSSSAATAKIRAKAKLSMEKAREIRASEESCTALASRFGVSHQVVSMVRLNRAWVEVSPFSGLGARG